MKTIILLSAILGFVLFTSCEDNSPEVNTFTGTPSDVSTNMQTGNWKITYYYDSDHEETSNYSSYNFSFNDNGDLTSTTGSDSYTGTWSTGNDDSTVKLIINFSSPELLEELSDDWHVLEQTEVKLRLEDISGGNGGTDYLTFEKI